MQVLVGSVHGCTIEEEHVEQFRCRLDCIGGRSSRLLSRWPQWVKYRNTLRGLYTVGDYDPARLRRLRMPALIVTGAQTVAFHRRINETLLHGLPGAEPLELGAGHNSPTADPEHFIEEWQKFQKRSDPPTRAR